MYGVQIDALTKKVFVINVINIFLTKVWMSTLTTYSLVDE